MLGKPGKGSIKLKCTEQAFPEFPELLFGTIADTGASYFDATDYLNLKAPKLNIRNFIVQYQTPILALCRSYEIDFEDIQKINEQGHFLIHANFVYLFLAFALPDFMAYMCDRTNELFARGFTVSDAFLQGAVSERFSTKVKQQLLRNVENVAE